MISCVTDIIVCIVPLRFHYGFLNLGAASLDSLLSNDMHAVCLQLSSLCLLEHDCVYIANVIFFF